MNDTMNVAELKQLKASYENKILEQLQAFSLETGIPLTGMHIEFTAWEMKCGEAGEVKIKTAL